MRRPRSQLSIHLYREYSPVPISPDKAPTPPNANDKDKASFLLEFAPEPNQTDVSSANRGIPDPARARLISLSFCGQTFLSATAAPALPCLSNSLCAYNHYQCVTVSCSSAAC